MSYVNEKSFYYTKYQTDDTMKQRLTQLEEMGVVIVGYGQFGIPKLMSGLYIERVWYADEARWEKEIKWIQGLIRQVAPNKNATSMKNACHLCNYWTPLNGCKHYLPDSRTVLEAAGYTIIESQGRFTVRKGKEIHRYKSIALAADVLVHSKKEKA